MMITSLIVGVLRFYLFRFLANLQKTFKQLFLKGFIYFSLDLLKSRLLK